MAKAAAVFLDRDGTIIEDCAYLGDPDRVRLLPGAGEAIRRFSDLGYRVVLVSNQSGIARGRFDERALSRVHVRLEELLAADGARLDGVYYCPYLAGPEAVVEAYRRESDSRKPGPGMLLQAARELNIDLSCSWMVGDSPSDVEAGRRAGCRTILIHRRQPAAAGDGPAAADNVADGLLEAVKIVEESMKRDCEGEARANTSHGDDRVVETLAEIRDHLERAYRDRQQQDFSVLRLFGALLQMFAIVAALWGGSALLAENAGTATARFTLACFLQLASIGTFAIDRFR